jgi:hypothetical protein
MSQGKTENSNKTATEIYLLCKTRASQAAYEGSIPFTRSILLIQRHLTLGTSSFLPKTGTETGTNCPKIRDCSLGVVLVFV